MVERWSSKPYVWVRFLLLLSMFNLNPLIKLKNKFLSDEKQKYFNRLSFNKTRSQQNFWYFKQLKKQNVSKTINRSFLKYLRKVTLKKHNYTQTTLRQKANKYLVGNDSINYTSLQTVSNYKYNSLTTSLSLFTNLQTVKRFTLTSVDCSILSYCLINYIQKFVSEKKTSLLTSYNLTTTTSFHFYKPSLSIKTSASSNSNNSLYKSSVYWISQSIIFDSNRKLTQKSHLTSLLNLPLVLHFSRQSSFFNFTKDTVTRFFPKGVMEFWSKNFYILNRNTKAYNLKGGTLRKLLFKKESSLTITDLQSLLLNSNGLENNLNYTPLSKVTNFSKNSLLFSKLSKKFLLKEKTFLSLIKKQKNVKLTKKKIKKKISILFQSLKSTYTFERKTSVKSFSTITQNASNLTLDLFFKNTNLLSYVFTNSILFKYLFSLTSNQLQISSPVLMFNLSNNYFPTNNSLFNKSNIVTFHSFNYKLKRRVLKAFTYDTFSPNVTMWYYHTIIRFIENCTGKKVYLKFNPFIENSLTFNDLSRCYIWARRVVRFQKVLGPRMFLRESLKIINVAIRYRDPTFLANWIRAMLKRTNFYKYKPLFRYLKYVFTHLFQGYFKDLGFKGIKLKLKGKICVAGNARTRTLFYRVGNTTHSTFDNRVVYDLSYINTFTGVLGFQLWFYY